MKFRIEVEVEVSNGYDERMAEVLLHPIGDQLLDLLDEVGDRLLVLDYSEVKITMTEGRTHE